MDSGHRKLHEVLDNIQILVFKHKHMVHLMDMLKSQDYPDIQSINYRSLPKIGYIAMMDKVPVAAGFLRRVEGDMIAHIEGLTSNPYLGSIIRNHGIEKTLEALTNEAKSLNIQTLMAYSVNNSIIKRAEDMGFQRLPHSFVARSIKE